ncbi:hypothetical protein SLEP1_g24687 [Rubroshorea leprosula]|uniref:Tropomyosin n=1 Tax=Rubroshorea leprosula TaxID=152421 RepID=A0AAV5JLR7_9ROSI|nr:hypothetical protein SLEP1_g24687 [Rubroshorea leprosula]
MVNQAVTTKSKVEKLTNQTVELKEELEKVIDEKENGIKAVKRDANHQANPVVEEVARAREEQDEACKELDAL